MVIGITGVHLTLQQNEYKSSTNREHAFAQWHAYRFAGQCENGAINWLSVLDHEKGEKRYNISLSHDMSSIAAFLIRLHQYR
jgi:hypothetical protein